ncbi:MAG: galactokinase [Ruminococcaceae bacterium]|nr:galactokinase [Oscillospiraceae bacterium]
MDLKTLKNQFYSYFGEGGTVMAFASPGRVNLIGEHTDYNGGFVFPAAITLGTTIVARKRNDTIIRMRATDLDVLVEADLNTIDAYKDLPWGNYQLGVASELMKTGILVPGCDLLYHDTTPHGGGLSSSAAIEVASALCMYYLATGRMPDMRDMAVIGQRAENNYVGVNCGIMDQFASAMGKKDHAIFLDCKDLSFETVPLSLGSIRIVISNTNKKRSLVTSKYNERRAECEEALTDLRKVTPTLSHLGVLTPRDFAAFSGAIKNPVALKRAHHVVEECERVKQSVLALKNSDVSRFGQLMNESHASLRDLYEVTGPELDALTEAAQNENGCLGSRMTGAGFGGCTVSLVENENVEEFMKNVGEKYTKAIGYAPSFYVTDAGDGGRILTI